MDVPQSVCPLSDAEIHFLLIKEFELTNTVISVTIRTVT